jgi:putative lipoic acid-binding regulatory protein
MESSQFRDLLNENNTWPSVYMFKFICPSDASTIAEVKGLFQGETSDLVMRDSSNGNYVSITVKTRVHDADEVIAHYEKAGHIKGLMAL